MKSIEMYQDNVIVLHPNNTMTIHHIYRILNADTETKIKEAKKIAAKYIGAKYVDGINLTINNEYKAGIYCDDMAIHKYPYNRHLNIDGKIFLGYGDLVIINETKGLNTQQKEEILKWIDTNTEIREIYQ